jgi:hypothetical protein
MGRDDSSAAEQAGSQDGAQRAGSPLSLGGLRSLPSRLAAATGNRWQQ